MQRKSKLRSRVLTRKRKTKSKSRTCSRFCFRSQSQQLVGELKQFGYNLELAQDERRVALQRAIKVYPVLSVMRKLNALYVLQKNKYPRNAAKFKADEKWLKSIFFVLKSKSRRQKSAKIRACLSSPIWDFYVDLRERRRKKNKK